jgi:uncharacterized membrane protein
MPEENISGAESMKIIQNMINKAKNQFSENGFMYLLWGWAILICSLGQFILLHYVHYPKHYMVWLLTWIVLIIQFIYIRKQIRKRKVQTYTEDIIKYVWICFVFVIFLMTFILGKLLGPEYYKYMNPVILTVYGIPTFLSGIILRFRALVIGGISCWVLSIVSTFIGYDYQLLLLGMAVIVAWIIPGYLLRIRYKKENI